MTLVVETGAGIAGAEAYASVATADAYFAARTHLAMYTTWTALTTAKKEGALREAADYLDAEFGSQYRGTRAGRIQGKLWPRTNALDDDGYPLPDLPIELQLANCELAGRAATAPLAADLERGGKVKRMKAGSVELEYMDGATASTAYGIVTKMLAPILQTTGNAGWDWK